MNPRSNLLLIIGSLFLFLACEKDDAPQPGPTSSLEEVIGNNYWKEKIHFMTCRFDERGDMVVEEHPEDLIECYSRGGGSAYPFKTTMDRIFVEKGTRKVHRHFTDRYGKSIEYYRNRFTIEYDDADRSICIRSPYDTLTYFNAVVGSKMKIVAMAEDEIIFDAPIKPFIWENWSLEASAELNHVYYLGIRVYWEKADPRLFEEAKPLD